jgi:uncharacterized SAM-binding protein YcdF (DUF218 family)
MFIISKIIGLILNPFLWIIALCVFALYQQQDKKRKKIYAISLFMMLFFSNPWLITSLQYPFHTPPMPMHANEKYEAGIVLGGYTSYDKVNKAGHFNMSSDRFIQAAWLYKKGFIKKLIVTGGQNGLTNEDDFVEAEFVASSLKDLGIPTSDIFVEGKSRNTIENAEFSFKILDSLGLKKNKVVLITSAFHMPRAKETFEKKGLNIRPYPCAFSILPSSIRFSIDSIIPAAWAFDAWGGFLKEMVGRIYLMFYPMNDSRKERQ